ncbi:hypothetical protein EDC94DRAFT_580267 [Helicostylum pulchrum]|nr:hypothetical protein EDC94DRAFT_580267 [Helicostylum pulchrum]
MHFFFFVSFQTHLISKRVEKYDPSTTSAEALKAVRLKGFIPSQECFDLLSCYLPGIQRFACVSDRGNRFDDSEEVPRYYVVDLTHFKSLQKIYFDVQLISTGPQLDSCLVKLEYMDGEKSYYQFKNENDTTFESISLEDIQNNQTSTLSMITFKCEKIEKFTLYGSEKRNIFKIHRGLPQKERDFSYKEDVDYIVGTKNRKKSCKADSTV